MILMSHRPHFCNLAARVMLAVSCAGLLQNAPQSCEAISPNAAILRVTRIHEFHSTSGKKLAPLTDGRGVVALSGALHTVTGRVGMVLTLDQNLKVHLLSAIRSCLINTSTATLKHQYARKLNLMERHGKCQGTNFTLCGDFCLMTLPNSAGQSPPWKANRSSANPKIPHIHKRPPPAPILS
jgi:hypothetical protein